MILSKKIILYGSADCPHCMDMKKVLDEEGIKYGYVDVLESLGHLKKYLNLRDANPEIYADIRANGKVGIPTLVVDDKDIYTCVVANLDLSLLR